jgi:hypothetical protein
MADKGRARVVKREGLAPRPMACRALDKAFKRYLHLMVLFEGFFVAPHVRDFQGKRRMKDKKTNETSDMKKTDRRTVTNLFLIVPSFRRMFTGSF